MKLQIHIPSVLATLLVVGGAAVLSAQSTVGSLASIFTIREVVAPVTVYSPAHPRDCVRIVDGTPYTVPAGRILTITRVGRTDDVGGSWVAITVDGALFDHVQYTGWDTSSFSCTTVSEGSVVSVDLIGPAASGAQAFGFLADA